MRIAVCDDDAADRKRLAALVRMYCDRHSMLAEVKEFAKGSALLRRMRQTAYSIVFMDIFLEKEHGVEIAHAMRRELGDDCILIFSTISEDFALEGFSLNARHYLVKPISYAHVESAMNRCTDKLLALARTLQLSSKQKNYVLVKDILYVEVLNKTCFVYTRGGVESTRKTIGELEEELGSESFLRCHRSYIVNLGCIDTYGQTDFILQNGTHVPIRQAGRNRIKQKYREYLASKVSLPV